MRRHLLLLLTTALLCSAPAWAGTRRPTTASAKAPALVTKQSAHFTLVSDLSPASMDSVLKLCEASLDGYRDVFGFSLYPNPNPGDKRIVVTARKGQGMEVVSNWKVKPAQLRITLPQNSPVPNGQIMPYVFSRVVRAFAIPLATYDNAAFSEGVADFLAAHVTDYAAGKLPAITGRFSYVAAVGSGSLQRAREHAKPGTPPAAAGLLDRIANTHGKATVGRAMRLLGTANAPARPVAGPGGTKLYKVAALCQQLVNMTGEGEIVKWFQEQHFSTVLDPSSVTAAALWGLADHSARCQLICQRWGANTTGVLDGNPVQLLLQVIPGEPGRRVASTPDKLTVNAAGTEGLLVWYQPATQRTYIVGTALVGTSRDRVTDDAVDAQGQPLHLK